MITPLFETKKKCIIFISDDTPTSTLGTTPRTTTTSSTTPSTTTISSTTPSTTTTSSTTPSPTTTSTPYTSTTPATTSTTAKPLPNPEIGTWNSSCIKLQLAAQLSFEYNTIDNKTKQAKYNLPVKTIVESDDDCKNFTETQNIVLHWIDDATKEENSFKLSFYKNGSTVGLGHLVIKIQPNTIFSDAKNDTVQLVYNSNSTFITPLHMSYHCTREQTLNLTETISSPDVVGTVSYFLFSGKTKGITLVCFSDNFFERSNGSIS